MQQTRQPWAILVASPAAQEHLRVTEKRLEETQRLITRAKAIASADKTCVLFTKQFRQEWHDLAAFLLHGNMFVLPAGQPIMSGIARCLHAISEREPQASVILIPADHCAANEASWLASAQGALKLGADNPWTVYLLHDKPENDPRTSHAYPGLCSSSVMIGSVNALSALCAGNRTPTIVDIMVEDEEQEDVVLADTQSNSFIPPLKVIHISSVEEYARLQRGDYSKRKAHHVDVHA